MYLTYNGVDYPCTCRPGATMVYGDLPEGFPTPVTGELKLYANDGFHLRTDVAEDYLRQTFEGGTLTLTNQPEPEPVEPPEPEPTEIEVLQQENKQLKDQVSALSTQAEFHEECLVELAQVVYA